MTPSKTKEKQIASFDPNGSGLTASLFGLPFDENTSELIIIPVPWEVTVSYRPGTSKAPAAILKASSQVDLYHHYISEAWKMGIYMLPADREILETGIELKKLVTMHHHHSKANPGTKTTDLMPPNILKKVNDAAEVLQGRIRLKALDIINRGKMAALLGGDHSTPLGLIGALAEIYPSFGILQIDAHADLRTAYEGFKQSHASVMHNALQYKQVTKLVQVGIRDLCDEEIKYIRTANGRIKTFFDAGFKTQQYYGDTWHRQCLEIINELPDKVYISFDIDGLDPKLCPNTGTPVPGGLQFEEVVYLIKKLVDLGKTIISFDLSEVTPGDNEWDANVGARLLYELACHMGISQGKLRWQQPLSNE